MYIYDFQENLTIEQLNELGSENWEITGILVNTTESFDAFMRKGFQEKTLIENEETGAKFWIEESFSYGESIVIIFLTIFIFAVIGGIIYNFLFKKNG